MKFFAAYIALMALIMLCACEQNPMQSNSTYKEGVEWYSDYPIEATYKIGAVYWAGPDTLLHVDDPIITYYSDKPIKDVLLSVLMSDGQRIAIPCYYEDKGRTVYTYNDLIYGQEGNEEVVSFRFDVMAYVEAK